MASISREPNGHRTIQFIDRDRKRKSIRLGKVSQRVAESIKGKVEALNAAQISRCALDDETARWISQIGDDLTAKLAAVGLIAERGSALLGGFLDSYIALRTDVKPNTRRNLEAVKARLVEFFGSNKAMREISPGDADAWHQASAAAIKRVEKYYSQDIMFARYQALYEKNFQWQA